MTNTHLASHQKLLFSNFIQVCQEPVTFSGDNGPRMPEVSSFWVQHLFLSSFSGPGRIVRVHLGFLPVSPLLVFAVTLETKRSAVFTFSHPHLRPGVVIVMDGFLLALKTQAGKGVSPLGRPVRGPVRSHNCWSGRAEILHCCRIGNWKCFIVCFAVSFQSQREQLKAREWP